MLLSDQWMHLHTHTHLYACDYCNGYNVAFTMQAGGPWKECMQGCVLSCESELTL